jgi:hypothetical protein
MRTHIALPEPIGIYPYFDKIQFWVRKPLDKKVIEWLRKQSGKGGLFVANQSARFNARFRQRIELRQSSQRALRWLAQHNDVLINRAEIALDLGFTSRGYMEEAWDFLHQHLVRRWHGKNQEIRVFRSTQRGDDAGTGQSRYDASRRAPNQLVFYAEDHTRVTGELNCLHLEWRLNGLKAVRAVGIESGQDLLEFDHRAFWQKRLLLYTVNRQRLGRLLRNRVTGKRRRTPEIHQSGRYGYDIEGKTGEACVRSFETVQELIDKMKSFRIHRALVSISNEMLLPPHTYLLYTKTNRQLDPVLASKSYLSPIEELSTTDMED